MGAPLRVKHASDKSKGGGKGKDKEDELTVVVKGASLSFALTSTCFSRIPTGTCTGNLPCPRFPVRDQRRNAAECIWKRLYAFPSCLVAVPQRDKTGRVQESKPLVNAFHPKPSDPNSTDLNIPKRFLVKPLQSIPNPKPEPKSGV